MFVSVFVLDNTVNIIGNVIASLFFTEIIGYRMRKHVCVYVKLNVSAVSFVCAGYGVELFAVCKEFNSVFLYVEAY